MPQSDGALCRPQIRTKSSRDVSEGPSICANGVVIPVEEMNESVRRDLEQKVLFSDVARQALEARLDQLDSTLSTTERATLEAQLATLD
jgi:hypothetical protein